MATDIRLGRRASSLEIVLTKGYGFRSQLELKDGAGAPLSWTDPPVPVRGPRQPRPRRTSPRYVKLYNKATAPTVGTDVPILTIPAPANATQVLDLGGLGKRFAAGIGIAVTAAAAATDTGVTVAGIQIAGTYV